MERIGMTKNLKMDVRKTARKAARIEGTVKYGIQEIPGRVVNVSLAGIALDLSGPFYGAAGSPVKVLCKDIGYLEGKVRWYRKGRVGIHLDPNSNANAKIASYFRFFHKDVRPPFGGKIGV
jgi:hypothetical protein